MDDMISRAAALEVIEAVKNVCWSQSGKVLCGRMYSQIKDLPTVDAVPVEWLQKKRKYASECDSLDVGIAEVLDMWEKEQEVRM